MSFNITDTLVVIRSHIPLTTEQREFICKEVRAQLADSNVLVLPSHLGVEWMRPGQSFDPGRGQPIPMECERMGSLSDRVRLQHKGLLASIARAMRYGRN